MINDDECRPFPSAEPARSQTSLCRQLLFCVCRAGKNQEAFHVVQNFIALLKPQVKAQSKPSGPGDADKKKKEIIKPLGRVKLEAGFLVLRLQASRPGAALAGSSDSCHSWKLAMRRRQATTNADGDIVYFHIGYMNFQNYHCAGLELHLQEERFDGSLILQASSPLRFQRFLPFVHERLDLDLSWTCSFMLLRSTDEPLLASDMKGGLVSAEPFPDMSSFRVWKGLREERLSRMQRCRAAASRQRRGARQRPAAVHVPADIAEAYSDEDLPLADLFRDEGEDQDQQEVAYLNLYL